MTCPKVNLNGSRPLVVGAFGDPESIPSATAREIADACDVIEIRLDLIAAGGLRISRDLWTHLNAAPILFTARKKDEGSTVDLSPEERSDLLRLSLEDASIIDIELSSAGEMADVISVVKRAGIPWVASYHDFMELPDDAVLRAAVSSAKEAGADVFKIAARLHGPGDVARLAEFQLMDHGIPVATMGMGPLAPVSRLLCAQSGSILNYGFLGGTPTAPGQWSAAFLKEAIGRLAPFSR